MPNDFCFIIIIIISIFLMLGHWLAISNKDFSLMLGFLENLK
jgi:hypothetical protein